MTTFLSSPDYHLRAILLSLCDDDATKQKITERVAALRQHDIPTTALKRKSIKDLWICIRCKTPFSNEINQPGNCSYHDGEPELDLGADCWQDMYEEEEWKWLEDNQEMMEEQPGGYMWSCCGERYGARPCETGTHVAWFTGEGNGDAMTHQKQSMVPQPQVNDSDEEDEEDEEGEEEEEDEEDIEANEEDEPASKRRKT